MNLSKYNPAFVLVALALLSGCASPGVSRYDNDNGNASLVEAGVSATAVGAANVGDTISLPEGNPTGASRADVIAEYFAASNRRCRQVLPRGGEAVRIACEQRDGSWVWVRSLVTSKVAQPLPAVATVSAEQPLIIVGESAVLSNSDNDRFEKAQLENVETVDVEAGETLWKFAERTTGSGVHWQAIAELNDIDDARTVSSGMTLLVPPQLAIGQ